MSVQQNADPILGTTYAGFAASRASEPKDGLELRLNGEARTYERAELRRRTSRRRAPVAAMAVVAVLGVGAAVGAALLYEPKAELSAPPPPPPIETATPAAEMTEPSIAAPAPGLAAETTPTTNEPAPVAEAAPAPAAVRAARPATAPPKPIARTAVAPKAAPVARTVARGRSSTQAAADRAATDRVSALAALDQEVNKAYAQALNAGAPVGPLSVAQENWIIRRDRVRREDPDMAEDLARARIAELQAIAANAASDPQGTR